MLDARIAFVTLFVGVACVPASSLARPVAKESATLYRVKACMTRGDWLCACETAHAFIESGRKRTLGRWLAVSDALQTGASYPDDHPHQKSSRGRAATLLGLHEVALEQYLLRARLEDLPGFEEARWDVARSALLAGIDATAAGNYASAARLFDLVGESSGPRAAEVGMKQAAQVRELAASPSDVELRLRFAREFWLKNGRYQAQALSLLEATLTLDPSEEQRREIMGTMLKCAISLDDTKAAEQLTVELTGGQASAYQAYNAVSRLARHHFKARRWDAAKAVLEAFLARPDAIAGKEASFLFVHLSLSEVAKEFADIPGMVAHLEVAATAGPGIVTRDIRQRALVRLGQHYLSTGRPQLALEYFEALVPGVNKALEHWKRDLYQARCHVALARPQQALGHLVPHLSFDRGEMYQDEEIPALAVSIHEELGTLDAFVEWLKPHAAAKENGAARAALKMAEIRIARRDADVASLLDRLRHRGRFGPNPRTHYDNWEASAAAEALVSMGPPALTALTIRYDALLESAGRERTVEAIGVRTWVLYAIGCSPLPEARAYLDLLWKRSEAREEIGVSSDILYYVRDLPESHCKSAEFGRFAER